MIEKRMITIENHDMIDITTGEVIESWRYSPIELIATDIILCDGDDRNLVFLFSGIK